MDTPRSLGFGPVFASKRVSGLDELEYLLIPCIPEQVKCDVAVFDYWIGNEDRTLTRLGGNPNLFWDVDSSKLSVFDHNLAFSSDYRLGEALKQHPFRENLKAVLNDDEVKREYIQKFALILQDWQSIVDDIPDEWLFVDENKTIEANIDFEQLKNWLLRLCTIENWGS